MYEPVLRHIRTLFSPVDPTVMSAFADDVGVATANLRRTARLAGSSCKRMPGGTGLSLNPGKTEVLLVACSGGPGVVGRVP